MLAPILLFAFNRPSHTQRTLEALEKNNLASQSDLYIFLDGIKDPHTSQQKEVEKVLQMPWNFRSVHLIKREKHLGLANNIVSGINEQINTHGKVIVLEDDIVTSVGFLEYMNDALRFYANTPQVMHISSYVKNLDFQLPNTFFQQPPNSWGWATWQRAWQHYDPTIINQFEQLSPEQKKQFDRNTHGAYIEQINMNLKKKRETWAIKWYLCIFLQKGLTLYPHTSLIQNIGFDGSGETPIKTEVYLVPTLAEKITLSEIPLEENKKISQKMSFFLRYGGTQTHHFLRYHWEIFKRKCKQLF